MIGRTSGSRTLWRLGIACGLALASSLLPGVSRRNAAPRYGYSREDDPLIRAVKKVLAHQRAGNRDKALEVADSLQWQIDELKGDLKIDLEDQMLAAVRSDDTSRLGYTLTHLVFLAMEQKFYWNLDEKLERYAPARARLESAQFYYEDILSHAVRRADKAQNKKRHSAVLTSFAKLRQTIGSPGLFGIGASDPDVAAFREAARELLAKLLEVYPDFEVVAALQLPAPPKR